MLYFLSFPQCHPIMKEVIRCKDICLMDYIAGNILRVHYYTLSEMFIHQKVKSYQALCAIFGLSGGGEMGAIKVSFVTNAGLVESE